MKRIDILVKGRHEIRRGIMFAALRLHALPGRGLTGLVGEHAHVHGSVAPSQSAYPLQAPIKQTTHNNVLFRTIRLVIHIITHTIHREGGSESIDLRISF